MKEPIPVGRLSGSALRRTVAASTLIVSGLVTVFASVILAAIFFVLAVIPASVGAAQVLAGLRMLRGRSQGLVLVVTAVGMLLGLFGVPGAALPTNAVGPSVEGWRVVLSGLVVAGNAFVAVVAVGDMPPPRAGGIRRPRRP